MTDQQLITDRLILAPERPKFSYLAALYFLESGDYLFQRRQNNGASSVSKFLNSTDVAVAFGDVRLDSDWMDAGVLRWGRSEAGPWYVYSAPERRKFEVIVSDEKLVIPLPRLVMLAIGKSYYIWAVKAERVTPNAGLFRAPFPNVSNGGSICWGSNTPIEANPRRAREMYERFLRTPFNRDWSDGKSKKHPTDVRQALKELSDNQAHSFPLDDLVSAEITLERMVIGKVG